MKMTITDQNKILNRKIMQNEAQYNLDRKAAKISALSSNNLDKYEYLTGEDFSLKPNNFNKYEYLTVEDFSLKPSSIKQTKFEYSPLGKIFNEGLSEDDKQEGFFKRLKMLKRLKKPNKTQVQYH